MVSFAKRFLILFVCVCMSACTTLRTVPDPRTPGASDAPALSQSLQPGDHVRVTMTSSKQIDMHLAAVEADALIGVPTNSSNAIRVPLDQIVNVERREFSGTKTGLLGGFGLVIVVAMVAVFVAMANAGP